MPDAKAVRGGRIRALLPAPGAPRALALSTLVGQTGSGLFLPVSALFFTRSVGLAPTEVGVGLAVAGLTGLAAAVPIGRIADRFGPRGTYAVTLLGQAAATAAFSLVHSMWAFVLVSTVAALAQRGGNAARGAVIGNVGTGEERVRLRAVLKSVTNIGLSLGTALAALALTADSRSAYLAVVFVNAASYVCAALPLLRVPAAAVVSKEGGAGGTPSAPPRRAVLRDRPYTLVTVLCGITSIHYDVLSLALPLWIAGHSSAPQWSISAVIMANTVLVVLLQVPFSRGTGVVPTAAAAVRRSGWVLWAGWAVIACTAFTGSAPVSVLLLVAGMVLHTAGELWQSAGSYGLSYELAPAGSHGEYQGFFSLGRGATAALAPMVVTTVCLADGPDWRPVSGWLLLGLVVAAASAAVPPAARRAERAAAAHLNSTPLPVRETA
ncbi:Multidrug resistance protein MdtH [Streptomyces netropsis]|uniref:MFS family permease n=1 Tax=Streptomyces syringium TaxID=76729 RepID=A0ABS4YA20_9ACTN|nr:MFS transporter [Streptomyces syringium]MBP2405633.1 MFS family permease [Streptomyces syringium]SPE64442.1 Multidrug resistance protein MdtH [Streptomyces netropsis]